MAREQVIINPENLEWEPIEEMGTGAWLKVLSYDEETKAGAYLIKFDNGFREPLHSHPGAHDILFLQGCLVDDDGNETCAGSYFFAPAGQENEHGPYTAKGDVIFFAYFDGPVFYPEQS